MNRQFRSGHDGTGRSLGYGGTPKVTQGGVYFPSDIDTETLDKMQKAFDSQDKRTITNRPGPGGWRLLEGEMAFKVRGSDSVLTALNGLEADLFEIYPDDREMVRACLEAMIQPIGFVVEDARTDTAQPRVNLQVGGTHPSGAPSVYNIPGQEDALISQGSAVVFGVPNLSDPAQFGTKAGGKAENKITLQPRAADKRSVARRVQLVLGQIINNPAKYMRAMKDFAHIATATTKCALRLITSFKVALLMGVDLLLKNDIIRISPNAPELLDAAGAQLTNEQTVARLGELIGVLDRRSVYGGLNVRRRAFWNEFDFDLKQRILFVPDPDSKAYNARNEFGFRRDPANNTWTSVARETTGEAKRDPIGRLFKLQLTHFNNLLETFTEAAWEERRLTMGRAESAPSTADTSVFTILMQPHGGLSDIK